MYRKTDRKQLILEDFIMPFGGKLDAENRWVKMSKLMPWEMIEDMYAKASFYHNNPDLRTEIARRGLRRYPGNTGTRTGWRRCCLGLGCD